MSSSFSRVLAATRAMASGRARLAGVFMVCLTAGTVPVAAQQATKAPAIDPKATGALRQMGAYLRTLKQFGIQGEGTRDEVLANGQKVQFGGTLNYLVRTPNAFRADIRTDRKQRQWIYDGKTLTIFAPRMNYYATVAAPSTISATLDSARWRYRFDMPLADLFFWGTSRDGMKDITEAKYIGPAYIDGVDVDQYAFRQEDVDWQIWVERGNKPLPRKLVITTKTVPQEPQYSVVLKWDLAPTFDSTTFAFTPPPEAKRITLTAALTSPMRVAQEKKK